MGKIIGIDLGTTNSCVAVMDGGDAKVIEYLNSALRSELTAVSQYWLHFRLQEEFLYRHLKSFHGLRKWRYVNSCLAS